MRTAEDLAARENPLRNGAGAPAIVERSEHPVFRPQEPVEIDGRLTWKPVTADDVTVRCDPSRSGEDRSGIIDDREFLPAETKTVLAIAGVGKHADDIAVAGNPVCRRAHCPGDIDGPKAIERPSRPRVSKCSRCDEKSAEERRCAFHEVLLVQLRSLSSAITRSGATRYNVGS